MKRKAIAGALWLVPGRGLQAVAHFAGIFVLARYLDADQFGVAMLALAVTGLFSAAADWGMGVLAIQRKSIDDHRAAGIAQTAGFSGMLALIFAAPLIAWLLGDPEGFVPLLQVAGTALVFAGFAATARARLGREMQFKQLAILDVVIAFSSAGGRIAFATGGYGAWSIVLGDLIAAGIGTAAAWLMAPAMQSGTKQPLLADGSRIVGTRLADGCFTQADRFLVGRGLGTGALGIYGFAWQHAMLLVSQLTPVTETIAMPVFSRLQKDKPALARAYLTVTRSFALVVIPFAGLLYLAAPWLTEWLYPARWHGAAPVMRALCVTAAATGLNSHPGLVWLALGETRLRLRWSLCNLVAIVGVIVAGLPHGVIGVAYALAARSVAATVVAQVITKRKAGVSHRDYALALVPGLVFGLAFYFVALVA